MVRNVGHSLLFVLLSNQLTGAGVADWTVIGHYLLQEERS